MEDSKTKENLEALCGKKFNSISNGSTVTVKKMPALRNKL